MFGKTSYDRLNKENFMKRIQKRQLKIKLENSKRNDQHDHRTTKYIK